MAEHAKSTPLSLDEWRCITPETGWAHYESIRAERDGLRGANTINVKRAERAEATVERLRAERDELNREADALGEAAMERSRDYDTARARLAEALVEIRGVRDWFRLEERWEEARHMDRFLSAQSEDSESSGQASRGLEGTTAADTKAEEGDPNLGDSTQDPSPEEGGA